MRDLLKVLEDLIAAIPVQENTEGFISELKSIKDSVSYSPPEQMRERWDQVQACLLCNISPDKRPDFDWQFNVLSIFSTIPVADIAEYWDKQV